MFECLGACLLAEDDKKYISLPGVVPVCVPHRNVCLTKARGLFALAVSYTEVDQ